MADMSRWRSFPGKKWTYNERDPDPQYILTDYNDPISSDVGASRANSFDDKMIPGLLDEQKHDI